MQSPAQKTTKLKSLSRGHPLQRTTSTPYTIALRKTQGIHPVPYGNLDRKAYDAEIRCLATFYSQATVLAHHVITSIITTLVAAQLRHPLLGTSHP